MSLEWCNKTELRQIVRVQTGGFSPNPDLPQERLIQIGTGQARLEAHEVSGTATTRAELEEWVQQNFSWAEGQLPCTGPNRGKCTIYPCSEARHMDCYLEAEKKWC